jgi:hypothetical protein
VNGVQADAGGVNVNLDGQFIDIGRVYYNRNAAANILSMSALVDSGADISYDSTSNAFLLKPANSGNTYKFTRRNVDGSEGKFYVWNARQIGES